MDQQIQTFESKIRGAFKKVKQDITFIKGYLKRQDDLLKEVKKELSDTVSSNDFYKFTEKLSEKLDGMRSYYVSKDELSKATERVEKEITQLKSMLDNTAIKGLSSEVQALRKEQDRLKKEQVPKKDYDKLLDDAEHNFKELAKEVAQAKSYDNDIKDLQNEVSALMKQLQEKEKPEKKTKTQEKQELKIQTMLDDMSAKSEGFEREIRILQDKMEDVSRKISEPKKKESAKEDTKLLDEINMQKREFNDAIDQQDRQLEKMRNELQLKIDDSDFSSRIQSEVQSAVDRLDFIRVEELNSKIDEFNTALEDLASIKDLQKGISSFEKESFNPLKKEITQLSKEQEAIRKILSRLEENADSQSAKKLSAFELRLDRIEEAIQSPGAESGKVEELFGLVKDLEEEQKMLISEISDISSKPTMNEKIIQSLSKDMEELKEKVDDIDLSMPKGKKGRGKDDDIEQLRAEIEFLRNNFVTQGDVDSTLNAISDELREIKDTRVVATKDDDELSTVKSDVSQIKKHLASKVVLLEAETDKYAGQIALLYEDMRKSLERQSFLERRLADIESMNDSLAAKEKDARISYESAREQLENTEKKLHQMEEDSDRKAKSQLTLEESSRQDDERPGFFSRMWKGIIEFFSEEEELKEDDKKPSEPIKEDEPGRKQSPEAVEKKEDEGFRFFDEEQPPETKKRGRPKTAKKEDDDELY